MKKLFTIAVLAAIAALPFSSIAQTLTLKWKTDTLLRVPESVLVDAKNNVLYVANIDGAPDGKDGKGFISKISPEGKIINLAWVSGLDAPKGMGLFKNNLYVADLTRVAVIDITTGKLVNSIPVDSSVFLNDITIDSKGAVYVSDSQTGKIHVIKNNKAETYFKHSELKGTNGLLAIRDGLYVVDFSTGANYKLGADRKITKFATTPEGADGVISLGNDGYIVSSWHGQISFVDQEGHVHKLLDTRDQKISSADIDYDPKTKTLYVPTFFTNTVMAYTFKK